jgi:hypothetical protein
MNSIYIFGNKKYTYGTCDDINRIPSIIKDIVPNCSVMETERSDMLLVITEEKSELWKINAVPDYSVQFLEIKISVN